MTEGIHLNQSRILGNSGYLESHFWCCSSSRGFVEKSTPSSTLPAVCRNDVWPVVVSWQACMLHKGLPASFEGCPHGVRRRIRCMTRMESAAFLDVEAGRTPFICWRLSDSVQLVVSGSGRLLGAVSGRMQNGTAVVRSKQNVMM